MDTQWMRYMLFITEYGIATGGLSDVVFHTDDREEAICKATANRCYSEVYVFDRVEGRDIYTWAGDQPSD